MVDGFRGIKSVSLSFMELHNLEVVDTICGNLGNEHLVGASL